MPSEDEEHYRYEQVDRGRVRAILNPGHSGSVLNCPHPMCEAVRSGRFYEKPSPPYSDEYYLAMAALDQYPIDDGLPKSSSIVFRIHQLGHECEKLRGAGISYTTLERQLNYLREAMRESLGLPDDAPDEDIIDTAAERLREK